MAGSNEKQSPQVQPETEQQKPEAAEVPQLLERAVDKTLEREKQELLFTHELGKTLAGSHFFEDAQTISQAAVKVMAGRELGIPPIVAMMSIDIIKGKVRLSGALIGALLKRHGYHWTFLIHDDKACTMAMYKDGAPLFGPASPSCEVCHGRGTVPGVVKVCKCRKQIIAQFTIADAERAGLTKPLKSGEPSMYDKYPKNMLYNRAITNFQRWHAPDVTSGMTVISEDEAEEILGAPGSREAGQAVAERKIAAMEAEQDASREFEAIKPQQDTHNHQSSAASQPQGEETLEASSGTAVKSPEPADDPVPEELEELRRKQAAEREKPKANNQRLVFGRRPNEDR